MTFSCASLASILIVLAQGGGASTQARDPRASQKPAPSVAAALATGWSALASGQDDDAARAADEILVRQPADHSALDLKVEALAARRPLRALDAYEAALTRSRIEDVFLLVPIARGTLEQIAAAGGDRVLQTQALQRLAADGVPTAQARLRGLMADAPGTVDLQLALSGNAAAAERLLKPGIALPPQTLAKALSAAGAAAVPTLRSMLKHPDAPVRNAAATSLGMMGAVDAIPDLQPLMQNPETRSFAAVALTRLGDPQSENVVQELLKSPSFDVRILAAQAYEGKGPGPWSQALMPALEDPNGLTRIRAAELLAPVAPEAARPVLVNAASDPNPVIRADVSRILEKTGLLRPPANATAETGDVTPFPKVLSTLRRLLRDPDATVRMHASAAILSLLRTGH
jgi:HEAT repeat protein